MSNPKRKTYDFSHDYQEKLDGLTGSEKSDFSHHEWLFILPCGAHVIIDFSNIEKLQTKYAEWYQNIGADVITATKVAWIDSISMAGRHDWKSKLAGLTLFWTALAELNITEITPENMPEILSFLLTHRWNADRHVRMTNLLSHVIFCRNFSLLIWKYSFNSFGIEIFSQQISSSRMKTSLKQLIPFLTDDSLSFSDWVEGGSFNYLSLDYGQYYVEHCMSFYDKNIALATAIESTRRMTPEFAKRCGWSEALTQRLVKRFLDGSTLREAYNEWKSNGRCLLFESLETLHLMVSGYFQSTYRSLTFESLILKDSSLEELLTRLKLNPSPPNVDRFRAIIWYWLKDRKEDALFLLKVYPSFSEHFLELCLDELKLKLLGEDFSLPTISVYASKGISKPTAYDSANAHATKLVRLVEQAGLTTFAALTGWRRSEMGFPMSSVSHGPNNDILDQHAFPVRCHVDWFVFKTSGKILERREITFQLATLIDRLAILVGAGTTSPCMFPTKSVGNAIDSSAPVTMAVRGPWSHFVLHYSGFQLIDDMYTWESLQKQLSSDEKLTSSSLQELQRLLAMRSACDWKNIEIDGNLKDAYVRFREELPIIEFFMKPPSTNDRRDWLEKYQMRTLRADWMKFLDDNLSDDTRVWIDSLVGADFKSNTLTRLVTNELMASCLYPTPHAFRHMFAEAIYRRFDGDVGWMIRSQFKHISKTMWLAYIRDKDNRGGHHLAKIRVINSLFRNYLKHSGEGYAGLMNTWLRRLMRSTTVMTAVEQTNFVNLIATTEIVDIKVSPWGYCLLKARTRRKANCAEAGEPQRHLASPNLCIGCIHNLMQTQNVDWILLHLMSQAEALQNSLVPDLFKAEAYKLVKSAVKQIRTLDPNHESLRELQELLVNHATLSVDI